MGLVATGAAAVDGGVAAIALLKSLFRSATIKPSSASSVLMTDMVVILGYGVAGRR